MDLHRGLVELYEGMRRLLLPQPAGVYRSLPYAFRMMGGMAGALRWGLPASHPA